MTGEQSMEQEFLEAYDNLADSVLRHCTFRISDHERAKDLTQETFMKVWEYIAEGNEVHNIRALIFHVLRNLITDEYRGKKNKALSLDILQEYGFDAPFMGDAHTRAQSDARIVIEAMRDLPDHYLEVLILRYVDELLVKDIADLVGETENTVSVRIHRGLKMLRKNLAIEEIDHE
jgi:RNA polymerase sigma-70 factor (ECF subfamily)